MVDEIQRRQEQLRLITEKMISIQEDERNHLASDIHDGLAQSLSAMGYKLEVCKDISEREGGLMSDQLDELLGMIHNTVDISREMITNLRPDLIDNIGLVAALNHFLTTYKEKTGISVFSSLPRQLELSSKTKISIFRVVQEALTNVYTHASTNTANVSLRKTRTHIILIISDCGKGFEMSAGYPWSNNQGKYGLLLMKERIEAVNGTILIESGINKGFRIEVKIPLI